MDKNIIKLDFKVANSKKYIIEIIQDSIIFVKELEIANIPKFYYHIF